jgi:hypothetical protein
LLVPERLDRDCREVEKVNRVSDLVLLIAMSFLAVTSFVINEWWKNEPNILTVVIRFISSLLLVCVFSIWYHRRSQFPKIAGFVIIPLLILSAISNSTAAFVNNGKMPVDPALGAVGLPPYYVEGGNLLWLGDWLWMGNSIGDFMLYSGMLLLLTDLTMYAIRDSKKVKNEN